VGVLVRFVVLGLLNVSIGLLACGGEVPRSALPTPKYERPIVSPWPLKADAGHIPRSGIHNNWLREDASAGSADVDGSDRPGNPGVDNGPVQLK